jgi:type II secretion system protein G
MNRRGFTLIELLVVIAIIGLLSTIISVAMGNARLKARDARRMSDLKQIQTALELYYTDKNEYPLGNPAINLGDTTHACLNLANGFGSAPCDSAFMGSVPTDPQSGVYYVYTSAGTSSYNVAANLEGQVNGLSGAIILTPSGIGK